MPEENQKPELARMTHSVKEGLSRDVDLLMMAVESGDTGLTLAYAHEAQTRIRIIANWAAKLSTQYVRQVPDSMFEDFEDQLP